MRRSYFLSWSLWSSKPVNTSLVTVTKESIYGAPKTDSKELETVIGRGVSGETKSP